MAGSVKGITVQIGADTTQLTTALRAIKAETKGLDSSMKKLKSSMSYNGTDTRTLQTFQTYQKGLSTQMNGLTKQISVQKKALNQWGDTVSGWERGLANAKGNVTDLTSSMNVLRNSMDVEKQAIKNTTDEIVRLESKREAVGKLTRTEGRQLRELNAQYDDLTRTYKAHQDVYANWDRELKASKKEVEYFTGELDNQDNTLTRLETEYAANVQQLRGMATELVSTSQSGQTLYYGLEKASQGLNKFSQATRTLSLISGATIVGAVMAAMSFEDAWTGVTKTVEGTPEQLKAVNDGLKELAVTTSSSYEDIAHYAELAGQMGVATDAVTGFTKTITMLGDTTNLVGEDAAQQIAKFANIMVSKEQQTNDYYERLGSTIVDLGNNFATTEADIMNMSMRMATAGKQAGFSSQEVLALSTTLSSLGLRAQEGGSSMSKMLQRISLAVATNSEELQAYAEVAGMTADEFSKAWGDNAANAFLKFLQGIQNSENELVKLNDLGLANEVRLTRAMGSLATNTDLYASALNTANTAWMENTAMVNEAEKRYATLKSALSQTWEAIKQAGNELGQALTPSLKNILGVVKDVALWFSKLDDSTQQTIAKMLLWGAAISPITKMISGLTGGLAGLVRTFTGVNNVAGFFAQKMGLAYEATMLTNYGNRALHTSLAELAAEEGTATTSVTGFTKALVAAHPVAAGMTGVVAGLTLMWIDNARYLKQLNTEAVDYLKKNNEVYRSVKEGTEAFDAYSQSYKTHKENIEGIQNSYETNAVAVEQYMKSIQRLNGQEHLSFSQKAELKNAVDQLNALFPDLGYHIDETTGKVVDETGALVENTDALNQNIEAYKQAAKEKAYIDMLTEYSQAIAESEIAIRKASAGYTDLKDEANKAWEEMAEAQKKYAQTGSNEDYSNMKKLEAQYHEISSTVVQAQKDIQKATDNMKESFRGIADVAYQKDGFVGLQNEFETLATKAQESGYEITAGFAQSIRDGSANVTEATDFIASLMTFEEVRSEAEGTGEAIDSSLVSGILNNSSSVQEATNNLNGLIDFQQAVNAADLQGSDIVARLTSGIASGQISVQQATDILMSGSVSEMESKINEMIGIAGTAEGGVNSALSSGSTSSGGSALISGAVGAVRSGLSDMVAAAYGAVGQIQSAIQGIEVGIALAKSKIQQAAAEAANAGKVSFEDYVPYMDRSNDLYYARDLGNAVDTSSISYIGASTIVPNGGTLGGYTSYASTTLNTGKIDQLINALNSARLVINLAPAQVNGRTLYEAVTEETTIAELLNGYGKGLANV
jgi:TP901 family phage tail tape measure protein